MLRKEIEELMKKHGRKSVSLVFNKEDPLAMYCFLQGGYLVDCWGHRVDRKKDIWGALKWDGKGNADRVCFATGERFPWIRNGMPVKNRGVQYADE